MTGFRPYRRKNKTNYHKRLSLLKSGQTRLVVRVSRATITAQLVDYSPAGDKVLFTLSSSALKKSGWKGSGTNLPAAYLVGYGLAKKAGGAVKSAILDIGIRGSVMHSRIYAVVKGVIDGGISVAAGEEVFPEEDRIKGEHIKSYAELLSKEDKAKYDKVFSAYLKNNLKPEQLPAHFEEIKSKL